MKYDVIICGGGPAGLTAAIYTARSLLKTLIIEKSGAGGQALTSLEIENFPGFPSIDGFTLCNNMLKTAVDFGAEIIYGEITEFDLEKKKISTAGGIYTAKAVIICTGAGPKKLNLPNESELTGRGVSYCATCDGAFFKGKTVAVTGGGNTAFEEIIYLSNICKKVYLIHRQENFRASPALIKKAENIKNIEFILSCKILEIKANDMVEKLIIDKCDRNGKSEIDVSALFIAIGRKPQTDLIYVDLDENGYILTDENMKTNVDGVFAAGDVRHKPVRQIVTACSDGAVAAESALKYILNE